MEEKRKDIIIGAKVDENLVRALKNYVALDTHISQSEFLRDAIREKLEREAEKLGLTLVELARLPLEELQRRIERRVLAPAPVWSPPTERVLRESGEVKEFGSEMAGQGMLVCDKCGTIWDGSGLREGEICPRCQKGVIRLRLLLRNGQVSDGQPRGVPEPDLRANQAAG
jgi:Arc/MetJ-type ribon-helix-helix transcriptional regulator